ncbi:hypothetical protein A9Q02_21360 [Candidatus Chloroploca asiatica]|uniref:Uncharacterized protein n=1 Tax=Candidatus Chloroploca asiatica TaxID=1506545 RepID=A0A2H3KRB9_9CHLR|nr:hypothetical protein A9Q02_21360 [Candidatus Chloroploca asiatica]
MVPPKPLAVAVCHPSQQQKTPLGSPVKRVARTPKGLTGEPKGVGFAVEGGNGTARGGPIA